MSASSSNLIDRIEVTRWQNGSTCYAVLNKPLDGHPQIAATTWLKRRIVKGCRKAHEALIASHLLAAQFYRHLSREELSEVQKACEKAFMAQRSIIPEKYQETK